MRQICLFCIGLSATVLFAADERLTFADGLFRRGLSEQAAAEYEAFLASPGDTAREALTEARFNLASCYEQIGQHEAARRLYREVVDQAEGDLAAAAKLRLSMSLLDAGLAAALGLVGLFCCVTNSFISAIFLGIELFGFSAFPYMAIICSILWLLFVHDGLFENRVFTSPLLKRRKEQP